MTFGFLNSLMLLGLAGLAIPPLIHLFNRRRFDVVDWGAMQFLQVGESTRRRLLLEEIVLMLLRMGLVAVLVGALAAPFAVRPAFASRGPGGNRDVVLVFDGSYSMGYTGSGRTAHEAAKAWALDFIRSLTPGDGVAVLQAKQQIIPILGELTHDPERGRDAVQRLPAPSGGCSWPEAVRAACQILQESHRPRREVLILSDGQRFGWADERTLLRWELLGSQLRGMPEPRPVIRVFNLDPHRPGDPANWSLAPIQVSRAVASVGQEITFRTALQFHGQAQYSPPYRIRLEIDGKPAGDLPAPRDGPVARGQVPFSFRQRFAVPGSHLVSVILEPDPPPTERPPNYEVKDHLPGDNQRDLALEVVEALPVLVVDGEPRGGARSRGTDFLRDALSPARDPTPAVRAQVIPVEEFRPASLTGDLGPKPGTTPRVLVLADVPRLTPPQQEGVEHFLAKGGGVLVTLGERADAAFYNEDLYREGKGWLPARLEEKTGDEANVQSAASPLGSSFFHPALDLFREVPSSGLADARFPRWWRVALSTAPGRGAAATQGALPVGLLTTHDPLFVERPYHGGRVLLTAVPLDNSWGTNLPRLVAFAPLVHELVYYLAGARCAEQNVQEGRPIQYRPTGDPPAGPVTLEFPDGATRSFGATHWPLIIEGTRETGVYRLTPPDGRTVHYVVQPDPGESDLTPCDAADREKVLRLVPMTYEDEADAANAGLPAAEHRQELWRWFLLGAASLLLGEAWLTRRLAKGRQA